MSELDGNVNINDVLQVVRFGGESLNFAIKGVKGIGKGIKNTGKLAKKGYNKTSLKIMQTKLFFHYHSKAISGNGELKKGMSLHSMEKLTGGDYSIVNLPTEDDKILAKFFSNLKKAKIAYAVMPDLIPNNGFSQIAIDPTTAHRLESIMDVFDFKNGKTVKESVPEEEKGKIIPFEEYWDEGNPEEKEKIIQSAVAEAEREQREKTKVVSMEEFVKGKNEQEIKKILNLP